RYILAARLSGPVDSAFPDGPPQAEKPPSPHGMPPPPPAPPAAPVKKSAEPINVIVVADTDMLDDRFWARSQDFFGRQVVEPVADNGDFVANAVDVLAGGQDLVGLRSRGSSARPFNLVARIQREADDRYAAERAQLERRLQQTQAKLRAYTKGEPADADAALAPEQAKAVEEFRADLLNTRRQLRAVQAALRQDIGALKMILEFCDIALVPILVAVVAIVLGLLRLQRRRRRHAAPA
ncbi:MAG: Gldg family protein, partial [Stellaceae bacterium]